MPMMIDKNTVVRFHYRLSEVRESSTELLEQNHDGEAMAYLHGADAVIPGIEKAMQGRQTGDEFEVTIEPGDAYGERIENAIQRIPLKHLQQKKKLKPGMVVTVNTSDGPRDVTIEKLGKFNVDVDTNHPLAGRTLKFEIKIEEVRQATAEEISHGHVHGPGGHDH